jgi:hypothetical protein
MIGAVGGSQPQLPPRGPADVRSLEPLIALLDAAARREDVVQLLGPSPAAALLDGLAEKARAVADLALQSVPNPEPIVVQATAARLPQAVADVLADQLYAVAMEPLPLSLEASVRVLSAGSPLVAAYLERAARYLLVCRLLAAGRNDLDALVDALKHAAGAAEAISGTRDEPAMAERRLLPSSTEDAETPPFIEQRIDVATTTQADTVDVPIVDTQDITVDTTAAQDDMLPELALDDIETPAAQASEPDAAPVSVDSIESKATATADESEAPLLKLIVADAAPSDAAEPEIPAAPKAPEADATPLPTRPSWRALPQLVTASYHVVPVAVALEQLRDGAQWIAAPSFPTDPDTVLGAASTGLAANDKAALLALGDRTARSTPALSRAVAALRLPAPVSEELLDALAPPGSRPPGERLSEQVRVLTALTLLRESRELSPAGASQDDLAVRLADEVQKPLPVDVRGVLDAMAVDPATRPMLGRAVRYVLATKELEAARDRTSVDTLEVLLGDDLPALGPIDRELLRALAAGTIGFRNAERPAESRRKRGRNTAESSKQASAQAFTAEVEGEVLRGEISLLDMAFADRPFRERTDPSSSSSGEDDRKTLLLAAVLVLFFWVLFR